MTAVELVYNELPIAVRDALPGDLYTDPDVGEVMVRNSVPARRFSLFVGPPREGEPEPWALVVLLGDEAKHGIGFKDGPETPIVVRRPQLTDVPARVQLLVHLRREAGRLQGEASAAFREARDYERRAQLTHLERSLADRLGLPT